MRADQFDGYTTTETGSHVVALFDAERKQVDALMDSPEPADSQIADVVAAVAEAGGLDYARERALRLAQQADGELDALAPSPARDALRDAITYVVDRRR